MGPADLRQGVCLHSSFRLVGKRSDCCRLVMGLTLEQSVVPEGGVGALQMETQLEVKGKNDKELYELEL